MGKQEKHRKDFADMVEGYGEKLSPQEMVSMLGTVLEEHGVHLHSQLSCDPKKDLDKYLVEEQ